MKSDTKAGAKTAAKTAAERLVAAGFGAMYERHGFHRVSATQYRMDRDGLVWRAVVGKGRPNDPNSFRDSVGCQIQGLPELLERLDEKWMPLKLPGTRIDVDWYTDSVDQAIEKELKPYYESRKDEPKTFWRWLFYKHPEPPVTLERRHPNIDHLFRGNFNIAQFGGPIAVGCQVAATNKADGDFTGSEICLNGFDPCHYPRTPTNV